MPIYTIRVNIGIFFSHLVSSFKHHICCIFFVMLFACRSSIFSLVTFSYILFACVFVWKHLDVMEDVSMYNYNKLLI